MSFFFQWKVSRHQILKLSYCWIKIGFINIFEFFLFFIFRLKDVAYTKLRDYGDSFFANFPLVLFAYHRSTGEICEIPDNIHAFIVYWKTDR